jgi:PHS family inorganic phosphate transporter-like MFS transporter
MMCTLMFGILAHDYARLGIAGKFVCFAIAQVWYHPVSFLKHDTNDTNPYAFMEFVLNFGPSATTFIIPAEIYSSRARGLGHGLSAAVGKPGAILSALLFNYPSGPKVIGLANILWTFFACSILGAISTFFLILETNGLDADALDFEKWQRDMQEGQAKGKL